MFRLTKSHSVNPKFGQSGVYLNLYDVISVLENHRGRVYARYDHYVENMPKRFDENNDRLSAGFLNIAKKIPVANFCV